MSDVLRWRYGDTEAVVSGPVPTATVIEIGDLIYQSGGLPFPASSQADQGSEINNQDEFSDNFLGVAMQRSKNGEVAGIRVATAGIFEYPVDAATFNLGDLLGAQNISADTGLEDQKVVGVSAVYSAIARAAEYHATNTTVLLIKIRSSIMAGEHNPATAST